MIQEFFKYLNNEIEITELEQWIYKETELGEKIGEGDYQFLLEFDYKKKYAQIELQTFLFENVLSEKEFARWKIGNVLDSVSIEFPKDDLYLYAKQNPRFLEGKVSRFMQLRTKKEVEITWAQDISQFVRHFSDLQKGNEKYLYLGTYEDSYINLVVNKANEIWLVYDVIDKEDYFAPNINEALMKLILSKNE